MENWLSPGEEEEDAGVLGEEGEGVEEEEEYERLTLVQGNAETAMNLKTSSTWMKNLNDGELEGGEEEEEPSRRQ